MTACARKRKSKKRASRGQMAVVFALTLVVFIGAMALGIDLSRLRTEAENVQHSANAAALAGVVFLPNYADSGKYRATEEATKNGFTSGQNGVTVAPDTVPGAPERLKVTITEPVRGIFSQILGLGPQTISRSAVAEYAQPLQMGAPDYVLGYAPFPTNLTSSSAGATQGFYLEARGPYGLQENGDAYSQYYESFSGSTLKPTPPTTYDNNPCNPTPTPGVQSPPGGCTNLSPNPDDVRIGQAKGFKGYDYVVDNPVTQTLVIKIFDAYDEGPWNGDATGGSVNQPGSQALTGKYANKYIDQFGCGNNGGILCPSGAVPVALQFSLAGPYQSPYDTDPSKTIIAPASQPVTGLTLPGASGTYTGYTCQNATTDCVIAPQFTTGNDPTDALCAAKSTSGSPSPQQRCYATAVSPYAYKFLNYAIIHGKGLYRIHVQTTVNADGTYGTGGNVFGLAVCGDTNPYLGTASDPAGQGLSASGLPVGNGVAVSDPASGSSNWNQASCPDPNAAGVSAGTLPSSCASPGTADAMSCVHIYADGRMCLYNNLVAGSGSTGDVYAVVPLGYVPSAYAGKTLHVRLYDVGDISGSTANNSVEVLTPAGDTTHFSGTPVAGAAGSGTPVPQFASSLPYAWSVAPSDPGSGFQQVAPTATAAANQPVGSLGQQSGKYNGAWLTMDVQIPANNTTGTGYTNMVRNFGGYWKMLYDIGPGSTGNDTTTWEISVTGSPVHLVTP